MTFKDKDNAFIRESAPALQALEKIRLAKLAAYEWRIKIGSLAATVLTPACGWIDWMLIKLQSGSDDTFAGLTALMLGALYHWVTQPKRQYAKSYKDEILPKIAKLLGDLQYIGDGKIPMEDMKPSHIIPTHSRYKSEDHFVGSYKDVRLEIAEIHLEQRRRSGKRTTYVTVFKGLAVLIRYNRPKFSGHTVLADNATKAGKWLTKVSTGLKPANMVDPEFEKEFDVYTDDQVEARYLIDPTMIETIKGLRETHGTNDIQVAYFESKTLILIPSAENYFEPMNIRVPATNPASIRKMKKELTQVLSLVDLLELYDKGKVPKAEAS